MPSVQRRVHYQANELERESVQMVDSRGKNLETAEAIERLGGNDAKYVELVSDLSALECQALMERHPDRDPEQVARNHFAAQARFLEEKYHLENRIVVAVHGEPDGSFHAHDLISGTPESLREALAGERQKNLHGPHGQAIQAWDKAWKEGQELGLSRNQWTQIRAEQKAYREQIGALQKERNTLQKATAERLANTGAMAGGERLQIRKEVGEKDRLMAERIHALESARIDGFWKIAGKSESLEHLVDRERETHRHKGEMNKVESREMGFGVAHARQKAASERESFRHLRAPDRAVIREAALVRELEAVGLKHTAQLRGMTPESSEYAEKVGRQTKEIEGILLRFEAAKLRDQEGDLAKVSGIHTTWADKMRLAVGANPSRRPATIANWAATYGTRKDLMDQRHDLERKALQSQAEGIGKAEPAPEMAAKLAERQSKERTDLRTEPLKMGGRKVQGKAVAVARSVAKVPAKAVGKALKKLQEAHRKVGGKHRSAKVPKEMEAAKGAAQGAGMAAAQGIGKVALTTALETAKAAAHQAKHAAQAVAVTAQAIATGIVNPAAGAKIAAQGYAEVGGNALKSGAQDLKSGGTKIGKDTATAAKTTAAQTLGGLSTMGMAAAPAEVQAMARTAKELALMAVRTSKALLQGAISLNPLKMATGAVSEVTKGTLKTAKAASQGLSTAKLPAVISKPLDLAAKLPLVGVVAMGIKQGAELAAGAAKAPGMEIDR